MASERYVQGTGTTSVVLGIMNDEEPARLVVLDHITATTINGTINSPLVVAVNNVTIANKSITTTVPDYIDMDLSPGWPLWDTAGDSGSPGSVVAYTAASFAASYPVKGGTGGAGEDFQAVGLSFTTTGAYGIGGIYLVMRKAGSPTDNLTLDLRTTSITGSVIATSAALDTSLFSTSYEARLFSFTTPVWLSAATKYYCQITRSGARDAFNVVQIGNSTNSGYSGGGAYSRADTVWSGESATDDFSFRTAPCAIVALTAPAASTGSTLTVLYHLARPSQIRN